MNAVTFPKFSKVLSSLRYGCRLSAWINETSQPWYYRAKPLDHGKSQSTCWIAGFRQLTPSIYPVLIWFHQTRISLGISAYLYWTLAREARQSNSGLKTLSPEAWSNTVPESVQHSRTDNELNSHYQMNCQVLSFNKLLLLYDCVIEQIQNQ